MRCNLAARVWLLPLIVMVAVGGDTACPTPEAVTSALRALGDEPRGGRVELRPSGEALLVALRDADGRLVGQKTVEVAGCEERARAVAVLVAAWQSVLAAPLPALPPPPAPAPPAPAAAVVATARAPRVRVEGAAGFYAAFSGGAFAPGGMGELFLAGRRLDLAARIALVGTGLYREALPPGAYQWTRLSLGLGPSYRFSLRRAVIDAYAEGRLALLVVEGDGFATTRRSHDFDPGLGAGVRVGLRAGPLVPFLAVGVTGWLRPQTVEVRGGDLRAELPRWEVGLALGLGGGSFR